MLSQDIGIRRLLGSLVSFRDKSMLFATGLNMRALPLTDRSGAPQPLGRRSLRLKANKGGSLKYGPNMHKGAHLAYLV